LGAGSFAPFVTGFCFPVVSFQVFHAMKSGSAKRLRRQQLRFQTRATIQCRISHLSQSSRLPEGTYPAKLFIL